MIEVSNTIDINIKSKVSKILEDNATSRLIAKMIGSIPIYLIIQKYLKCIRFQIYKHIDEYDLILLFYRIKLYHLNCQKEKTHEEANY